MVLAISPPPSIYLNTVELSDAWRSRQSVLKPDGFMSATSPLNRLLGKSIHQTTTQIIIGKFELHSSK